MLAMVALVVGVGVAAIGSTFENQPADPITTVRPFTPFTGFATTTTLPCIGQRVGRLCIPPTVQRPFPKFGTVPQVPVYIPPVIQTPIPPDRPTAICNDGTTSFSKHHSGTCSHHGGVSSWVTP